MCKRDEHTQYKSGEAIPFNYTVTGAGPQSQVTTYSEEGQVGWNKIRTFAGFLCLRKTAILENLHWDDARSAEVQSISL